MAGRVEYLEDDTEIVRTRFRKHDNYGSWDDYLGLEHAQAPVVVIGHVAHRAVVARGQAVLCCRCFLPLTARHRADARAWRANDARFITLFTHH